MKMGRGEKQEKLRQNIYADFISVCVAALESGKLMTLIPKLFFLLTVLPSALLVHAPLYRPATLPTAGMGNEGYSGVGRSHDSPPNVTAST